MEMESLAISQRGGGKSSAVQSQKAVSAYFTSKQILPFGSLPCKAKRQYLLTLQVSRYCLLALHGRLLPFWVSERLLDRAEGFWESEGEDRGLFAGYGPYFGHVLPGGPASNWDLILPLIYLPGLCLRTDTPPSRQTPRLDPMLFHCRSCAVGGGQYWNSCFLGSYKAKRLYLLTWKVSRYCLLALQGSQWLSFVPRRQTAVTACL